MARVTRFVVRALSWSLCPGLAGYALPTAGFGAGDAPFAAAMLGCWFVGVVLTWRAFRQPAGWAFLGLGTAMAWSVFAEELALRQGDLLVAALADSSWVWWFVLVALALQATPSRALRPRRLLRLTLVLGVLLQVLVLVRSSPLEGPFRGRHSPWALPSPYGDLATYLSYGVGLALGACTIASVLVPVRAWRVAREDERRRLLWLGAGASPLVPGVAAAFVLSYTGYSEWAGWPLALAFVALAAGAALSVLRYRLYDVERVVTDSAAYALASGAVVAAFGAVVLVISRTTPLGERSQLPTIAATIAGVVVARLSYVWARRAVEQRLDPTRHNAVEALRRGLAASGNTDLDSVIGAALRDPSARVLYPAPGGWVAADGVSGQPGPHVVDVRGAKLEYDPARVRQDVVTAVAAEASAEIDNVALRAELARQVEVVTESRARLATAHLDERRRLERDLHDGAQQRLLAIALHLQSARLSGADQRLREEADRAVVELGATVQELRDLASGLQPAALAGGGLLAAVADLADRIPAPITYRVPPDRFDAAVESTAWFVIAEAVANAVKHASSDTVGIEVDRDQAHLIVSVTDRGVGGADPGGHGLQGLADRVAAAGGRLTVRPRVPSGTEVRAVLPCA
ncbi:sensor histidine kinase [Jiangella gansuensis]|uniref:sensor histidine kinase n=1 Tax=Jiangella gansuensis TaxID=281473 RepID=UPI0004B81481|nr:histidine kinase [Jiangella gansuensis]